jgi:hypothetical protein
MAEALAVWRPATWLPQLDATALSASVASRANRPDQAVAAPAADQSGNCPDLGMAISTVGLVLRRLGLNRLSGLEPTPPAMRYERERPGEMIHLDIKTLGRIARPSHRVTGNRRDSVEGIGWEHLHVAIDDCSRLAYTEVLGG